MYGIRSNPQPVIQGPSLHRLIVELGQLVGGHVRATDAAMQLLEDRITDLEGHIEHGPEGRCGVCGPDDDDEIPYRPETVGAPLYVIGRIMNADTESGNDDD